MRAILTAAIACISSALLMACGGGVDIPTPGPVYSAEPTPTPTPTPTPAPTPTPNPAPAPDPVPPFVIGPVGDTPPPVPPFVIGPVVDLPAPGPSWVEAWAEDWTHGLSVAGGPGHSVLRCGPDGADPDQLSGPSTIGATAWGSIGYPRGATPRGGALVVDDTQYTGWGWALLSAAAFDHAAAPLRLAGVVDLQPDPGAWLGLALIQDESDYREIALYESAGALRVGVWAPCVITDLGPVSPGPHDLGLTYHQAQGWTYTVDGSEVHREPISKAGAPLMGRPRVGVYVVNIGAESRRLSSGRVRASVGRLSVSAWR